MSVKIAEFARWCIQKGPFVGYDLDSSDVQKKAEECGLLTTVKYDPEKHGELDGLMDFVEPGDDIFVLSDELKAATV